MVTPQCIGISIILQARLSRGERVWSNSHLAFVLQTQQQEPNEVHIHIGENIIGMCPKKAELLLKHHTLQVTCSCAPSFTTNPINMSRNSWHFRNEMMMMEFDPTLSSPC